METLQLGILGTGQYFRQAHWPYLVNPDGCWQVVALCRRQTRALGEWGESFSQATPYTDWQEFLSEPQLEAVLISTPHHLHYPQVKAALQAGLHVLVDKPLCLQAAEAEELVHLALGRKRVLSVAYNYHYTSVFQAARQLVAQGKLGRLTSVACLGSAHGASSPILDPASWYHDVDQAGGGSLMSGGTHRLAAILWLTGLSPQGAYAVMRGPAPRMDYQTSLTLELEGGAVASLLNEAQGAQWRLELSVHGATGALFIRNQELTWVNAQGTEESIPCWPPETCALADFARAIRLGTPLLGDPHSAYWVVAAVEAAYRSAATGRREPVRPLRSPSEREGERS